MALLTPLVYVCISEFGKVIHTQLYVLFLPHSAINANYINSLMLFLVIISLMLFLACQPAAVVNFCFPQS